MWLQNSKYRISKWVINRLDHNAYESYFCNYFLGNVLGSYLNNITKAILFVDYIMFGIIFGQLSSVDTILQCLLEHLPIEQTLRPKNWTTSTCKIGWRKSHTQYNARKLTEPRCDDRLIYHHLMGQGQHRFSMRMSRKLRFPSTNKQIKLDIKDTNKLVKPFLRWVVRLLAGYCFGFFLRFF